MTKPEHPRADEAAVDLMDAFERDFRDLFTAPEPKANDAIEQDEARAPAIARREARLDQTLRETFPASDALPVNPGPLETK